METRRIVTTSWDDGERTDLKIAEILRSRGVAGTFYVPITAYQGRPPLTHAELRELSSEGFEIGGHSFSHKRLQNLSEKELAEEVGSCKPILEDILGAEVRMFCYPYGKYDSKTLRAVRQAGYWGARTVRMLATGLEFGAFEMPTTVQICPQPLSNYIKNVAKARKIEGVRVFLTHRRHLGNWLELGKKLFDRVLQNGGVWHLYGHSQEIEHLGLWKELEEMLDYVCKRKGVRYVPNGELVPPPSLRAQSPVDARS